MDILSSLGPGFANFIANSGAGVGQQPIFTNRKSDFELDNKGRVKIDPNTGLKIPAKDRRKWTAVRDNPYGMNPATALNLNVPNMLTGANMPLGPIAKALSGVVRIGQPKGAK